MYAKNSMHTHEVKDFLIIADLLQQNLNIQYLDVSEC